MNRKKIVAGNWKMNLPGEDESSMVKEILLQELPKEVIKIFFPSFPFITSVKNLLQKQDTFFCGAQNCSEHEKGAYTGEVSADMLLKCGASYVLVGHSERRAYFNENDEQLASKIKQCLKNNLTPVFCFGEMLEERKNAKHFSTVESQLQLLRSFSTDDLQKCILAYEPVWAIGTGETASPQQAQEMHAHIRSVIAKISNADTAGQISILYGGSCNAQNARELFACSDVDGGLIGGASLKAADFCSIIRSFS